MANHVGKSVVIVGAGLAGSLAAVAFARLGFRVGVYERRSDPRAKGYIGGRSINLAVSARGIAGLAHVGLDKEILGSEAIAMPGRMIHSKAGTTQFQPYSAKPTDAINSFSRGGLNLALIHAAAREPNVSLFFDHPCVDVDFDSPAAVFQTAGGGTTRVAANMIVGTDGAYSAVRMAMQKTDRFEYSQEFLGHGYKELHIPAKDVDFAMEPHALHIWPRGAAMMIALPNRDRTFTNTLFWPLEGEHSFAALEGELAERRKKDRTATPTEEERARVAAFFKEQYPDAVPIMPTLVDDFFVNPTSSLVTVRCWPWQRGGKVALLGDAAHAIVPFFGQGMNAAFEDVVLLTKLIAHGEQAEALEQYERERKPNADAIADMAIENFVEMRDLSGRPEFQLKKKYEQTIHAAFPDRVSPRYNLVSFSTVPYVEARRRGEELDAIIANVQRRMPAGMTTEASGWRETVVRLAKEEIEQPTPREAIRVMEREDGWIDISPPISPGIKVWPGDTPMTREIVCDMKQGANITLSALRSTVHLGAHADGANHYGRDAKAIDEMPLGHYVGLCRVVDVLVKRGERVRPEQVVGGVDQIREARVLIRTGTFPDFENWNSDFAALSVELVDALAARGVKTIGVDTPSVDLQDSKDLPAHKAILGHEIAIVEGIAMFEIPAGLYELCATPLRLVGFDASPVRALVRSVKDRKLERNEFNTTRKRGGGRMAAYNCDKHYEWFAAVRQALHGRYHSDIKEWFDPVLQEDAVVDVQSPGRNVRLHVDNWYAELVSKDVESDALVIDIARAAAGEFPLHLRFPNDWE